MARDPFAIFPWPARRWQREAFPLVMESIRSGRRDVMQACTGAGKTWLQIAVLSEALRTLRPGWRIVVLVPRERLVEQTVADARQYLGASQVGAWYGRKREYRPVVVACNNSAPALADQLTIAKHRIGLLMVDECHRSDRDDVRELRERCPPHWTIGVTATPYKSTDPLPGWDQLCYRYTVTDAIEDGVLVPFRPVGAHPDEHGGDVNDLTIRMIHRDAPAGPGIVSATDIEDAEWFAGLLRDADIPAEAIHSKLKRKEQADRLARLQAGDLRCLVHVELLTEGVDLPWLRWLAMRRPRSSAVGIVQEAGRVLRTMREPDQWGAKTEAVLLLPHATPVLEAMLRDADLGESPAKSLGLAAERELAVPVEQMLPPAVAARDLSEWAAALRAAVAERVPVAPEPEDLRDGWREWGMSGKQLRALARELKDPQRSAARYLDEPSRKAIKGILDHPTLVRAGTASDLLSVLYALRAEAKRYRDEHRNAPVNRRYWPGIKSGLPSPPAHAVG